LILLLSTTQFSFSTCSKVLLQNTNCSAKIGSTLKNLFILLVTSTDHFVKVIEYIEIHVQDVSFTERFNILLSQIFNHCDDIKFSSPLKSTIATFHETA